jgi:hypothetical protein
VCYKTLTSLLRSFIKLKSLAGRGSQVHNFAELGLIDSQCNVLPNVIKFFGRVQDNQADRTGGGNSSGDDCVDNSNKAYVHQAFLSD